jgi:hypothetical protein
MISNLRKKFVKWAAREWYLDFKKKSNSNPMNKTDA